MLKNVNFVAINVFSSGILIFRSVLFLRYLSDEDLGLIMLFTAIINILRLAQIGLFNGGLRLFSVDADSDKYDSANSTNITFSIILTILLLISGTIAKLFLQFDLTIFIIAAFTGGLALLKNWFESLLIARKRLKEVNALNFISSIVSLLLTFAIFELEVIGAIISIVSLYLVYVLLFVLWQRDFVPAKLYVDKASVKIMLKYGFIPYLTGIAYLLNNQIDRFFITKALSLSDLGQFYLASTFLIVFNLVPKQLNSLFTPNAVNSYTNFNLQKTKKTTKIYFLVLLAYVSISSLILFAIGEEVISLLFPDKIDQLNYLFIMLPGIVALTLSKPISFILYVALDLKSILISNFISLISYLVILISLLYYDSFSLTNVAYGKSFQGIIVLIFLILTVWYRRKIITDFTLIKEDRRKVKS